MREVKDTAKRTAPKTIALRGALLITLVWALLYLPHLRTSPGWYGDETLIHYTSLNLVKGRSVNFAIANTFWHPHYPYQPAYSALNGVFAWAAGGDLLGSRFFNTLLALLCGLSLFRIGARPFGFRASLFAALMFLTYAQSVIHFRMSYAHNAAGLGILLMTLYLLRRASPANDWRGGLGLAVAAGAHPLFVHAALCGLVVRWRSPASWARLLIPSGLCLLVGLGILYAIFGNWLVEDLLHLKWVFTQRGDSDGAGFKGFQNFLAFLGQDWFHAAAAAGLVVCVILRRPAAALVGLGVLFLLVRNRQNLVVFYYQAVVILPVLCLGWAGLFRMCERLLRKYGGKARRMVPALYFIPLGLFLLILPASLGGSLRPRNQYWVTQSTGEVETAAAWINARTSAGDVVAGNANIAWLLNAWTVPYLQLVTWYGDTTQGYENGNRKERFLFDASLENCQYAIFGDIDLRWTIHEPNVNKIVGRIETENWPLVWRGANYLIFRNPRFVDPDESRQQPPTN